MYHLCNIDSIPLITVSYAYYSVYGTLIPLFVTTKDTMGIYRVYTVVTFENLVTNNRSVFLCHFFSEILGVFKHPKHPIVTALFTFVPCVVYDNTIQ